MQEASALALTPTTRTIREVAWLGPKSRQARALQGLALPQQNVANKVWKCQVVKCSWGTLEPAWVRNGTRARMAGKNAVTTIWSCFPGSCLLWLHLVGIGKTIEASNWVWLRAASSYLSKAMLLCLLLDISSGIKIFKNVVHLPVHN